MGGLFRGGGGRGKGYVGTPPKLLGGTAPHPLAVHILNWYFCNIVFTVSHGH